MKPSSEKLISIYYGGFTHTGGGAYTHASILRKALVTLGYRVRLITLDDIPLPIRFIPHLCLYFANLFKPGLGFIIKGKVIGLLYRLLFRQLSILDVYEDVYIAPRYSTSSITILHALWSDNLQSYQLSPSSVRYLKYKEYNLLSSFLHPLVTVSQPYKNYLNNDHFSNVNPINLNVVPLGIDQDEINLFRSSDQIYNKYSLCFCGSLEERKNLKFLFHIFRMLYRKDNKYNLTIIGEGPLRNKLSNYAKIYHLPIKFTGKLQRHEMLKQVSNHSLMIHTSTKESFSFSLLEAKLLGLYTFAHDGLEVPSEFIDCKLNNFDLFTWFYNIINFNPSNLSEPDLTFYSSSRMANQILNLVKINTA